MPNNFNRIRSLICSLALLLFACGQNSTGQDTSLSSDAAETTAKEISQTDYNGRSPDHPLYRRPEWPKNIRKETYGDPEIFETPRIQFVAKLSGDKLFTQDDRPSLWSMKLDGSDRRLVADPELLNMDKGGISHKPVRSPNNRYVALPLRDKEYEYFIGILDLKESKKWIISEGGGPPNFNWTQDSNNLIYYANRKHYNYHLPTNTLSERPVIYASALFLLPGDKQFLGFESNGYAIYTFDGKLVKRIDFDFPPDGGPQNPIVSPSGDYLYFNARNTSYLVDVKSGKIQEKFNIDHYGIGSTNPIFVDSNDTLYFYGCCRMSTFSLTERSKKNDRKPMEERSIWSMSDLRSFVAFNIAPKQLRH